MDKLMEALKNFYNSQKKADGVPVTDDGAFKYSRFAIADFDNDGEPEVIIETDFDSFGSACHELYMFKSDDDINFATEKVLPFKSFSTTTFLDNGIAYSEDKYLGDFDKNFYCLLNKDMLDKLNCDASVPIPNRILKYMIIEGTINKFFGNSEENLSEIEAIEETTSETKTEEEYKAEKAIINSGNKIEVQIKDFTSENLE